MKIVVRAPNHLGDGLMARGLVWSLAQRHDVQVFGPRWLSTIYHDLGVRVVNQVPTADVGVVLSPSLRAAWQLRRCHRVVGWPTDFRRALLTDVVPQRQGMHRRRTYTDLLRPLGVPQLAPPVLVPPVGAMDVVVPDDHLALCPASISGGVRQWPHFAALRGLRAPVVYSGPGEEWVRERFVGTPVRHNLPLSALMRAWQRARQVVGNDSGLMHLAAEMGLATLVIFGSTDPKRTGPLDAVEVVGGQRLACAPCQSQRCDARTKFACMDVSVNEVMSKVIA